MCQFLSTHHFFLSTHHLTPPALSCCLKTRETSQGNGRAPERTLPNYSSSQQVDYFSIFVLHRRNSDIKESTDQGMIQVIGNDIDFLVLKTQKGPREA